MKFDFLSREARSAVITAQRLARGRGEEEVGLEHLLHALADLPDIAAVLGTAEVDVKALQEKLRSALSGHAKVPSPAVFLGDGVLRLFDVAQEEARERGAAIVEPIHLLLALPLATDAPASDILRTLGATLDVLDKAAAGHTLATGNGSGDRSPESGDDLATRFPQLHRFARDLTALAHAGKLDPVVGRHAEIRRLLQILGRRSKNSPILIGEPGVGKTALAEGLAQRIADGDVPRSLEGRRVFALDVGALVAGARFRGEFEERVRGLLAEVRETGGEVLLFVDEIHTLVGAGKGDGSLDAASLLKPALARGELAIIGATTVDEYRRHLEKDAAFERRFAPIFVEEPNDELCLAMLRAVKPRFELAHDVRIGDAALVAAVALSRRYVSGRALPDKALDLLDEAASRLRLELDSHPDEMDALAREQRTLEVEQRGLARETGADAEARRRGLAARIAAVRAALAPISDKWQAELAAISALRKATAAVEDASLKAELHEKRGQLEEAARLRYGELPALHERKQAALAALARVQGQEPLLEAGVETLHVARVVEDWTGIPVSRMLEGERAKILAIEDRLRQRVIGQDEAVRLVGHAIKRSRAGLADPGRPIGSFLFLGPTGVGKTELAKALAEFLFDDEHALVRLDMSEYMEKHAVARLTGAPPGYVGYEEGGQLTEAVRRKPYAVVLLDEVEKAHPDVFNVLLAVLDDGRLTDSSGRTVSFANAVLIMTSNLGSQAILEAARAEDRDAVTAAVTTALRGHFRPEFLNRVDETVVFKPLSRETIALIVDMQVKRLARLLGEHRLSLALGDDARDLVAGRSYDPAFGARPVKRTISRMLRDPIAEAVLEGRFAAGDTITVSLGDDGVSLRFSRAPRPD